MYSSSDLFANMPCKQTLTQTWVKQCIIERLFVQRLGANVDVCETQRRELIRAKSATLVVSAAVGPLRSYKLNRAEKDQPTNTGQL